MAPDEDGAPPPADSGPAPGGEAHEPPAPEHRVAGSPRAMAANAALLALTRAARSFTLYDPSNKVVRALIADYREKLRNVLDAFGALELDVHPFELVLGSEVVYVEKDRERSLAFRLFRDGVRRMAFSPETTWQELLRLLQILSIRYTGVRQQEDDLVTLLRKAGFDHIRITAIEGFVPEEEHAEPPIGDLLRGTTERYDPPPRWDLPLPPFPEAAPLRYRPVDPSLLARLAAEESDEAMPALAVRAVSELLQARDLGDLEAVLGFAVEVRELLLVEERGELLRDLPRMVRSAIAEQPEVEHAFLLDYLDLRTLRALAATVRPDDPDVPPELAELLDAAPDETLGRLLDLLVEEGTGPRAPLLRRLVVRGCRHSPETLVSRLLAASGTDAVALLRLLAEVDPQAALRAAMEATSGNDVALQREALRHLETASFSPEIARALNHLIGSSHEEIRVLALPVMAERGGPRVFAALQHHAEKHWEHLTATEAEAVGRALARSSGRSALEAFSAWLRPRSAGLLGRLAGMSAPHSLQRVAVAGLQGIGGEEAEALLGLLAEKGQDDVAARSTALIEARRRPAGGRGG